MSKTMSKKNKKISKKVLTLTKAFDILVMQLVKNKNDL